MKKNILFGILTFVFMFIGISNVYAADPITLTQEDFNEAKASGTVSSPTSKGLWYHVNGNDKLYILGRNNDYIIEGSIILDDGNGTLQVVDNNLTLNNATINGMFKTESSTTNTLNGQGIIIGSSTQYGGELTINGSIEFRDRFESQNANSTIINGGTFKKGIDATRNTDVTINNATITTNGYGIRVAGYSTLVINNATIEAGDSAVLSDEAGDVTINGGSFTGGLTGLLVIGGTCKLSGGTFKTTRLNNINDKNGAIAIATNMSFADLLEIPYVYSAATDYSDTTGLPFNLRFLNVGQISVIEDSDEPVEITTPAPTTSTEEKKEETKNPKTGDNILVYISMLLLSVVGVASLRLYKNN